jgi:hydroxyacylglutathione hydrolase
MSRRSVVCWLAGWLVGCVGVETSGAPEDGGSTMASKADDAEDSESAGEDEGEGEGEGDCPAAAEVFPEVWPQGGPACDREPAIFVHRYDEDTFIFRQSLCTSFEGPFLYLLFGEDRALLEDTGAGGVPIRDAVFDVIGAWLEEHGKDSIELVVMNSHAHGDHVAGNAQFEGQPGVDVVGFGVHDIATFFDIDWPEEAGALDLGGRIVDVLPIPGHEDSHVALYDRNARLLLTGDTVYPGRLFIDDFPTYLTSLERLRDFSSTHPTCWVLGTHIEMTSEPGVDFEFGVTHHPDEHDLQLTPGHLDQIVEALHGMADNPRRERHDDFIIFPL